MEKLIYLLHKPADRKIGGDFTQQALSVLIPRLKTAGAREIVFTVADLTAQVRQANPARLMGDWESFAGALHFWLDNSDERARLEPMIRQFVPDISGYLVAESVVQSAPRTWQGSERRPGVTQIALLHKAAGVTEEEFFHNWHMVHSPFSFLIHPWRVEYIRNSVVRSLTPGAPPIRSIVLEKWNELRDLTEDSRYLGGPEVIARLFTGPAFADWTNVIVGPTSEYEFA